MALSLSTFFEFPSDYISHLFCEWLSVKEVAYLDTATTNACLRDRLSAELARKECLYDGSFANEKELTGLYYSWLNKRSMRVDKLYLSGGIQLTEQDYYNMLQLHGELKNLSVSQECRNFGRLLPVFFNCCRNLTSLTLSVLSIEPKFCTTFKAFPSPDKIRSLTLEVATIENMYSFVSIVSLCSLEELTLHLCHFPPQASVVADLVIPLGSLTSLAIEWCTGLTRAHYDYLFTACRSLTSVDIGLVEMDDSALAALQSCVLTLRKLTLTCYSDKTSSLSADELIKTLSKCSHLEHVNILRANSFGGILDALAEGCPRLHTLKLTRNGRADSISDSMMMSYVTRAPQLAVLGLHDFTSLSDAFLSCLGDCCPLLRELDLRSTRATGAGIARLLRQCSWLERVDVGNCVPFSESEADLCFAHGQMLRSFTFNISEISPQWLRKFFDGPRANVLRLDERWQ